MTNYLSYLLYFFSNLLIVIYVPDIEAQIFLSVYSFSSLLIGPLSFIFFSRYTQKSTQIKILIILINFSLFIFDESNKYFYFIYTLNLFFCDLFSSQMRNQKLNFLFKLTLFLSTIPLIFNIFSFDFLILLRIFLCSTLLIYLLITSEEYLNLDIKYPYIYQFITNLNYFGTLFLLTLFLEGQTLKVAYIILQIGLSIILKLYDLKIRKIMDSNIFEKIFKVTIIFIFFIPISFMFFNLPKSIIILYYISFIILIFVKYKFLKYEQN